MFFFTIDILDEVYTSLYEEEIDDKLLDISLKNEGVSRYRKMTGYYNLGVDPIMHLNPVYLTCDDFKGFLTEVVFESGNSVYAIGKPEKIHQSLTEYINSLPETNQT